jgi:hypothetical protein
MEPNCENGPALRKGLQQKRNGSGSHCAVVDKSRLLLNLFFHFPVKHPCKSHKDCGCARWTLLCAVPNAATVLA